MTDVRKKRPQMVSTVTQNGSPQGKRIGLWYNSDEQLHTTRMYCCAPSEVETIFEYLENTYQVGLQTLAVLSIEDLVITAGPCIRDGQTCVSIYVAKGMIYATSEEDFRKILKPVITEKLGVQFPEERKSRLPSFG